MLHLPQNLRLIRLLADQTQTEFGELFSASKAMIVSYEKGKAKPDELFISRLAKYAQVSENDIKSKPLRESDIKAERVERVEKVDTTNNMNIKDLRLKHRLSQQDVADKTGIPRPRIAKWEEGKGNPKADDSSKLANFFASLGEEPPPEKNRNGYGDVPLNNLTESNKVLADGNKILAEANKTLAEANKTLAEANHVISKNHDELIQLTKMIVANSTASPKSRQVTFGPEENVPGPAFGRVLPSGSKKRADK